MNHNYSRIILSELLQDKITIFLRIKLKQQVNIQNYFSFLYMENYYCQIFTEIEQYLGYILFKNFNFKLFFFKLPKIVIFISSRMS